MKIMARPIGPGCRPSDQTPSGSGGKAASIPRAALSEVRRKAWETRREMYGPQGHRGTYGRGPFGSDPDRMLACLIRLLHEGTLSEGQVAKATGLDRISIRRLEDEHRLQVEDAPQGMEARSAETLGSARQGDSPVGRQSDAPISSPTSEP